MSGARALGALNLLLAAVQCAFGNFATLRLQADGFSNADIGYAVSIGALAAMISQIPSGWLVDRVAQKRVIAATGLAGLALAAALVAAAPGTPAVFAAFAMHGAASALLGAAVTAMTLIVSGEDEFGVQIGLNARFGSIGNAAAAIVYGRMPYPAALGLAGLVCAPALIALALLPPGRMIAREPDRGNPAGVAKRARLLSVRLSVFTGAAGLFFAGNAALVPFALLALAAGGGHGEGTVVTATILAGQIVVATISPAIGRAAERHGRKPLLLIGFAMLPIRAALLFAFPGAWPLVGTAVLDGVSGAVIGVMVPLVAADLSRRNGLLTLTVGTVGLAMNAGAAASSSIAGVVGDMLGLPVAIVVLGAIGAAATAVVALLMPETRGGHDE